MHTLARSHAQIAPVDLLQGLAANQDYTEYPKQVTIRFNPFFIKSIHRAFTLVIPNCGVCFIFTKPTK
jgi:hypothetical protein